MILRNLLNDMDTLSGRVIPAIKQSDWLNAFLIAVGIWQIVDDYLHSDPLSLNRAEKIFEGVQHPLILLSRYIVIIARKLETSAFRRYPGYRNVKNWNAAWGDFVQALADVAIENQPVASEHQTHLLEICSRLLSEKESFPVGLRRSILRLPNCFRSFDQRPEDIDRMSNKFIKEFPSKLQPVVVVGIRTSGSYMAPLFKSYLQKKGFQNITIYTIRPGVGLLKTEKSQIRKAIRRGGIFTLIDDPPVSGKSMLQTARELEQLGVPTKAISLVAPLSPGTYSLPPQLGSYKSITLLWEEHSIHDYTTPESVQNTLSGWLFPGLSITHTERIPLVMVGSSRGHHNSLFRVSITHDETGKVYQRDIFVKGTGLGYFGDFVQGIAQQLSNYFPAIYGFHDGLVFRSWISEEDRLERLDAKDLPAAARSMVNYIWDRHQKLQVPEDTSLRRFGEFPAWEVASNLVSRVFGKAQKMLRVPVVDPLMRMLMTPDSPSIVDGNISLSNWFLPVSENQIKKVAFERSCFRNDIEYTSYDPVLDLASLAVDLDLAVIEGKMWAEQISPIIRPYYENLSGKKIDEERWLLYQLVRLWEIQRSASETEAHILQRAYSRVLQRYYSAYYFMGLPMNQIGEFCAFDLDGVLETDYLGFPALSPASAACLRALALDGFRSILVTGRSLPEVIDRCSLYPVVGGVAEYGAVIYSNPARKIEVLLSEDEQRALDFLRRYIKTKTSYTIDPGYQYAVRAYQFNGNRRRVRLSSDQIRVLLGSLPPDTPTIRAIPGEGQTDFMAERINKAVGIRALLRELEGKTAGMETENEHPLAFAAGDSLSDLPMMQLAKQAAIPAHASRRLHKPAIKRYPKAYQAGLVMAVTDLLHHSPQAPELPETARMLIPLFSAQENGTKSMLLSFFHQALRRFTK